MSELVAIACVVDSSLTLSYEWINLLTDYISPLLLRLNELYPQGQFRISFVCYATAASSPTLRTKQFFSPPPLILKDMQDDYSKFGIGYTGSGGTDGMAALEGLVAAIELFDLLRRSVEIAASYIIHVAACPPDSAERPLHNISPRLDSINWSQLPSEFRKRSIHYSNILLVDIPQLTELHTAAAAGQMQTPWFTVRPKHLLHLSGFPASPKGQKSSSTAVHSPDSKRTKNASQPIQSSPKAPTSPAKQPPTTLSAPASSSPLQVHKPAQLLQQLQASPQVLAHAKELAKNYETKMAQLGIQLQTAESSGNLEEAQSLRKMHTTQSIHLKKFTDTIAIAEQAQKRASSNTSVALTASSSSTSATGNAAQGIAPPPAPPLSQPTTSAPPSVTDSSPSSAHTSTRPLSATSLTTRAPAQSHILPTAVPATLSSQMQKLLEQHNRVSKGANAPAPAIEQPVGLQQPIQTRWQGTLMWNGLEAGVKKQMQTQVVALATHMGEMMQPETWPTSLPLVPSSRAVPTFILQEWIKRHKCTVFMLGAQPHITDPQTNDSNFRSLIQLLVEKQIYAIATWNSPTGVMENRILFFIIKNPPSLAGVYFPSPGMPELPKAIICELDLHDLNPAAAMILSRMQPEQYPKLMQWDKETRMKVLQTMGQQLQNQRLPAQQPQQPTSQSDTTMQSPNPRATVPGNANPWGVSAQSSFPANYLNTMGASPQLSNAAAMAGQIPTQTAAGTHQRTLSGGVPSGALSYEMLQSFMQRNQEGPTGGAGS